ncbi:MAG: DoxX family protein [Parachlamydiaceae bacterium]|nr:DoxX family protein [Parachlamydiaceae bacterium]
MIEYSIFAQILIATSIVIVWVFRFDNIVHEFHEYGIPDLVRNIVGALKISLSTLLITGIWYPNLVFFPALIMAFLMFCAQFAHFKAHHPLYKYLPSLVLMLLSLFVAFEHSRSSLSL